MQQLTNERWAEDKSKNQLLAEMGDELADVIACALFVAYGLGIDMDTALEKMFESDKRKIAKRTE